MHGRTVLLVGLCWALLLCAAIALSVLAANNETLPGDRTSTDWLQDRAFPGQDISDALRSITGTEAVLATGAALCLLLWLRGYRRQAVLVAAGLALLPLLQFAVKELVDRPRPSPQLVDIRAGVSSPTFPSGHVMSGSYLYAFLTYLALTLPLPRWAAVVLTAFSASILGLAGLVNVWLGVHWPTDVLGAWLWCAILFFPLVVMAARPPGNLVHFS